MGWHYRKSVNLGGGFRLNFSKSGIGISGGVKGLRLGTGPRGTRLTASIPGTGLYYTKNLSGNRRSNQRTNSNRTNSYATNNDGTYLYTQTVTNSNTGETRELRARTQYELNQLVQLETERQRVNEIRQKQLESIQQKQKQVDEMNRQLKNVREEYNQLINYTLKIDDRIDWDEQMIKDVFPEFNFEEKSPTEKEYYKISFFKSLFINEKKFDLSELENDERSDYEKRRTEAIAEYTRNKAEFESQKNRKNGELIDLKNRFEESDKDAVERYISIVLTKSQYPIDLERDFEVIYDKSRKRVLVNYLFQDIDSFPIVEKYKYNRKTDEIEEVLMDKKSATLFYSNVLYSIGIRTMHEIYESVYTGAVKIIGFNGYIEDEEDSRCVFTMSSNFDSFTRINLKQPVERIISLIDVNSINDFTSDEEIVPLN